MSGDEKSQQIGQLVSQLQAAKIELSHLSDLVALLEERNQAWKKVAGLCAELQKLGINASAL